MRTASLLALALCGAILTSCGADAQPEKALPGSAEKPVAARPNPASSKGSPEEHAAMSPATVRASARPPRSSAATRARRRRKLPTVVRASARRPCELVTKAQAEAIVGRPLLGPVQAPQGPTCIYRDGASRSTITLGVQSTTLAKLAERLRGRPAPGVSGRAAYCARLATPALYVAISARRVLSISAPCGVARRFAAAALARLRA